MFAECSGEPSTDWQRRWLIRRFIQFNNSTIDKLPYPEWYQENPLLYNSTRCLLPPSSTSLTYIHDPDYNCDPYHNLDIYDQETLTFKETINVPFHDFVQRTNMTLDTTKKRDDGSDSHSPVHHAEEQDREIQVIVTPPAITLRPILKPHNPIVTEPRSPPRFPAPTNEIRAAMTSSPSSPQSPEHPIKEFSTKSGTSTIGVPDTHKAGDPTITPATTITADPAPKTRRIKRALTCEFEQNQQPNNDGNPKPTNTQQGDNKLLLQLDANQLANITTTNNLTGEQCLPIFSAIASKQKRRMPFAPMDFQHFSIDAFIDSGALVNCMPENEYQKLKNMSPLTS